MQMCLVLCKTLDVFVVFYAQENGQMGEIVDSFIGNFFTQSRDENLDY